MKIKISLLLCALSSISFAFGSDADCQFYVGEHSVPRLKIDKLDHLWPCMGYLHSQYRGYQMEFFRRASEGQLAEVYGFSKLKNDVFLRLLNLPQLADRLLQQLDPRTIKLLEGYSTGVNRGLQSLPESQASKFRHHGVKPETWGPRHTLTLLLLQSFLQTKRGFEMEVRAERMAASLKLDDVSAYRNDLERPWATTIIKASELPQAASAPPTQKHTKQNHFQLNDETLTAILELLESPAISFQGSNNFVLAPSRTTSGHAILGNDPHLEIFDPQYFFWISIDAPGIQLLGATVPGIPGIPIGTNNSMAWGLTNSFFDVADLVVIDTKTTKLISDRPTIPIKVGPFKIPFFFKRIEWTDEEIPRPILPIDSDRLQPHQKLVLNWVGSRIDGKSIGALFDLPFSKSVEEFDKTLQLTQLPSWHFVFADVKGHIGFRTSGLLPKMTEMNSFGFKDPLHSQKSFLSSHEAPALSNPKRGFIVTANNHPWPEGYRLSAGNTFEPGFRAFRMEEIIQSERPRWSLETAREIQCDTRSIDSEYLTEILVDALNTKDPFLMLSSEERGALVRLREAKPMSFDLECRECALYSLWLEKLRDETKMDDTSLYYWLTVKTIDPPEVRKILHSTFLEAFRALKKRGNAFPRWGDIHRNDFLEIGKETRDEKFAVFASGGHHSVRLGQSYWQDDGYFQMTYAPSMRFLVELAKPPRVLFVQPSQNIRIDESLPFKDDPMSEAWAKCDYQPLSFGFMPSSREDVISVDFPAKTAD